MFNWIVRFARKIRIFKRYNKDPDVVELMEEEIYIQNRVEEEKSTDKNTDD